MSLSDKPFYGDRIVRSESKGKAHWFNKESKTLDKIRQNLENKQTATYEQIVLEMLKGK